MGRKRARYENVGNIQSIFTVNFREPNEIIEVMNTFRGSEIMEGNLANLFCQMKAFFVDYEFDKAEQKEMVSFAAEAMDDNENDKQIIESVSIMVGKLKPGNVEVNLKLVKSVLSFLVSLPATEQVETYEALGDKLNDVLFQQTKEDIDIQKVDLEKLLKTSSTDAFENADPRLKAFIYAAVKPNERFATENKNNKRLVFCSNVVENMLKARNMKFVSLPGLAVLTLVYIFSGRSRQTCSLFSSTGAKGSYRIVTEFVLPNSKETSYRHCKDGVTVFYSFDNAQKLFKQWRLHGKSQDKSLAMVATSIVHCYPDGLVTSNIQYTLRHSPMIWLHSFEINEKNLYLVEVLDVDILKSLIKLDEADEDLVLGRFDFDIESAIQHVKKETLGDKKDIIQLILDVEEKDMEKKDKFCVDGHRNVKPRANQIKCKVCKKYLDEQVFNTHDEEHELLKDTVKQLMVRNDGKDGKMSDVIISDVKSKATLYPRVRNNMNENDAVYHSQGVVLANPNTFPRVKLVMRKIKELTGTSKVHNSSITFKDSKNVEVKTWGVNNIRTWVVITADGLPHKLLIDVVKHCFICDVCGEDFDVMSDVTGHMLDYGHKTFVKEFGNCIVKIGGLHMEMTMLRSFVSLTWNIYYSFLCRAIGFLSPKAQLVQQKVTDLHKGWDTFMSQRFAILREIARLFLKYSEKNGIEANSENFEVWEKTVVKNENLKVLIQIQKYFGTSIWLYRAGTRSNHFKLSRAGSRVFSGLFHINGNHNYSLIELYDDYLMTSMEMKDPELFEHFKTRMVTNLKKEPFCSESHDARHEEANKNAQNLLSGRDLDEFDLMFTIVDDLVELKSKVLTDLCVEDRSKEMKIVIPDYEIQIRQMRVSLRNSGYFDDESDKGELETIEGEEMSRDLLNIFNVSREKRDSDILNVIRYSDFSKGYNSKSRIPILKLDKSNVTSLKEMEDQALILLHCIEEKEEKDFLMEKFLNEKEGKDKDFFQNFIDCLIDQNYSNLIEK